MTWMRTKNILTKTTNLLVLGRLDRCRLDGLTCQIFFPQDLKNLFPLDKQIIFFFNIVETRSYPPPCPHSSYWPPVTRIYWGLETAWKTGQLLYILTILIGKITELKIGQISTPLLLQKTNSLILNSFIGQNRLHFPIAFEIRCGLVFKLCHRFAVCVISMPLLGLDLREKEHAITPLPLPHTHTHTHTHTPFPLLLVRMWL